MTRAPVAPPTVPRADRTAVRVERRRAERDQRKAQQRRGREGTRSMSLIMLSLGAVALGVIAIIGYVVLTAPPPPTLLQQPGYFTPTDLADGLTLGRADAPVTIDLWEDFQCPVCQEFTTQMEPVVISQYVTPGKVRLVYHEIDFLGPDSVAAAVAARVAADNGRFWPFHDYLFANQYATENSGAFSQARLEAMATAVGLDLNTLRTGQADPQVKQAVTDTQTQGAQLNVRYTPTIYIGDQRIIGLPQSYTSFQSAIDAALAKTGH